MTQCWIDSPVMHDAAPGQLSLLPKLELIAIASRRNSHQAETGYSRGDLGFAVAAKTAGIEICAFDRYGGKIKE